MKSVVAINARIFTSIGRFVFLYFAITSGFNPIEMINLSPRNSMGRFQFDDIEL